MSVRLKQLNLSYVSTGPQGATYRLLAAFRLDLKGAAFPPLSALTRSKPKGTGRNRKGYASQRREQGGMELHKDSNIT